MLPRLFLASVASLISGPSARYPWMVRGGSLPMLSSCVDSSLMRIYPSSSTRRFSSENNHDVQSPSPHLVNQIQQAYYDNETDGILSMMQNDPDTLLGTPPKVLIRASIEATRGFPKPRAAAAGVINAIVGTCAILQEDEGAKLSAAKVARSIWDTMEELLEAKDEADIVSPDIVTYCLVYCATLQHDPVFASSLLERARHASKKQAGSKRRKVLAAARRRPSQDEIGENSYSTLETNLQQILGDESLQVLHDTDDVLVLNKPSGVVCYHSVTTSAGKISRRSASKSTTGSKDRDISLEDALLHFSVPLSTLNPDCLGLVHRLDRGTSGCMVWSKSDEMHAKLVSSFFLRKVRKQYTALVSPAPPGHEPGESIHLDGDVQGHAAHSKVTVLECFGKNAHSAAAGEPVAALLQIEPTTGRRHQVRVHCAQGLNAPVVLDPLYTTASAGPNPDVLSFLPEALQPQVLSAASSTTGTQKTKKNRRKQQQETSKGSQRFFLHASSLSIPNLNIDLKSSIPKFWEETLDSLREL